MYISKLSLRSQNKIMDTYSRTCKTILSSPINRCLLKVMIFSICHAFLFVNQFDFNQFILTISDDEF